MQINVAVDTSGLDQKSLREQRRLAYNVSQALNNTTLTAQGRQRDHIAQVMTLRNGSAQGKQWLLQRVKMQFASVKKDLAFAVLYIDQSKDRLLLAGFEDGSLRGGFVGADVAVPHAAVARIGGSVAGKVDPHLTFTKLGLKQVTAKSGAVQWKGKQRTFQIRSRDEPLGAVFQRVGPGRDDIRVVYSFKQPFHLQHILNFIEIASSTMRERWPIEWTLANARNPSK